MRPLGRLGERVGRLVEAPKPDSRYGPFAVEADAAEYRRELTAYWAGHLNAYDGYFDLVEEPEAGWWVLERRGRREPRKRWLSNLFAYTPNP